MLVETHTPGNQDEHQTLSVLKELSLTHFTEGLPDTLLSTMEK